MLYLKYLNEQILIANIYIYFNEDLLVRPTRAIYLTITLQVFIWER